MQRGLSADLLLSTPIGFYEHFVRDISLDKKVATKF